MQRLAQPAPEQQRTATEEYLLGLLQGLVGHSEHNPFAGIAANSEEIEYTDDAAKGLADGDIYGQPGYETGQLVMVAIQLQADADTQEADLNSHSRWTADQNSAPTTTFGRLAGHMAEIILRRPSEWEHFAIIARTALTHTAFITYYTINTNNA